jgi:outer membrane receptor protein involved in Fe transport
MMTNKGCPILFLAATVLVVPARSGIAQSIYGTIVGTVTDSSDAVVPSAAVTLAKVDTGEVRTLTTDSRGNYRATNLSPGTYTVHVELTGFKAARHPGVIVEVGQTTRIDIVLELGPTSEVIQVVAESPLLNRDTSGLGQVVDSKTIMDLPIVSGGGGRNFFNLALLAPGVMNTGEGFALNNMRVNGGRPRADDYLLDGTSIQQIVFGGPAIVPPPDAIQEFRVDTNSYPAEYGRISGGVFSAVTRSGGNAFHGSGWWFFRDETLDARDHFLPEETEKPDLRHHDFGFTLGGPIVKDKLFFFTDYQGIRDSGQRPQTGVQVPTPAMKAGDFSSFLGSESVGTDPCGQAVLAGAIVNPTTGCVFPGNVIPRSSFSPIASNFLPYWPDPTEGGFNFGRLAANEQTINQFDLRIDYLASQSDKFFGVLHWLRSESKPAQALPDPVVQAQLFTKDEPITASFGWDHTFNPNVINTLRFGIMTRDPKRVSGGYQTNSPTDFGFTGVFDCPTAIPDAGGNCGTPFIGVQGFQGLGGGAWLFEPAKIFQLAEAVSWIKGRHSFKLGGDFRYFLIDNSQPNNINGNFSFNQQATSFSGFEGQTGHSFASFLLGYSNNASWDYQPDFFKTKTSSMSLYAQDDWRINPSLTFNLGLRYQFDKNWTTRIDGTAGFFDLHGLYGEPLRYRLHGVDGAPDTAKEEDYNNFGPRVGFAWNPRPELVIRGAYGLLFTGNTTTGRGGNLDPAMRFVNQFGAVQVDNLPPILAPQVEDLPEVTKDLGNSTVFIIRDQPQQQFHQWNIGVERQFFGDTVLSASYAGSKGQHLINNFYYNPIQRTQEQTAATGYGGYSEDSPGGPAGNGAVGWLFSNFDNSASSTYNSLQVRAQKRHTKGYSFIASYTLSRLTDDASSDWAGSWGGMDVKGQDYFTRFETDKSISAGDIKHRFSLSAVVELPSPEGGAAKAILGDWMVSALFQYSTGLPFGIDDSCYGYCSSARSWTNRPDKIGDPNAGREGEGWVNTAAYRSTWFDDANPFGDSPRYDDAVREPEFINLDLSVRKAIAVGKDRRLELRADLFNALNRTQLANPIREIGSGNFGVITRTRSPNRQVQLGVRFTF